MDAGTNPHPSMPPVDAAAAAGPTYRGLLVDWGGVLTIPLDQAMADWCASDGIDLASFRQLMRELLIPVHPAAGEPVGPNPVHALEAGAMAIPEFEAALAVRLATVHGGPIRADGLLARMVAAFRQSEGMVAAVRRARAAGIRTGLLSNSWGLDYPRAGWDGLFDAVVISGEVGLRKPDPDIYRLAAERLGLPPQRVVFVDDLPANVRGAAAVGMAGIRHVQLASTLRQLEVLLAVELS